MKKNNRMRGFTILEMLVVIAVVIMISSFVLVSIRTTRMKSRDTQREQNIKQIQNALAIYSVTFNGNFPQCASSVAIGATTGADCFNTPLANYFQANIPTDPLGGTGGSGTACDNKVADTYFYCYKSPGTGGRAYDLWYALEGESILGKNLGWQDPIGP